MVKDGWMGWIGLGKDRHCIDPHRSAVIIIIIIIKNIINIISKTTSTNKSVNHHSIGRKGYMKWNGRSTTS